MTVSSGTYIRSIVHDIGLALGSAAHVVKLTRTRQGEFVLDPPSVSTVLETAGGAGPGGDGSGGADTTGNEEGHRAMTAPEAEAEAAAAAEAAPPPTTTTPSTTATTTGPLQLETFSGGCVEWSLLERAIAAHAAAKKEGKEVTEGRDDDGWLEWERDLLAKCKEV